MTPSAPQRPRPRPAIGLIRVGWAALLLATPAKVLRAFGGPSDFPAVIVARVLGIRHAIQGTVEISTWPRWRRTGFAVDAAHSLTAAALGISDNRWRRLGLVDSVVAATFAVGGLTGRQAAEGYGRAVQRRRVT